MNSTIHFLSLDEDWIGPDNVGNKEDDVFEILKWDHEKYLKKCSCLKKTKTFFTPLEKLSNNDSSKVDEIINENKHSSYACTALHSSSAVENQKNESLLKRNVNDNEMYVCGCILHNTINLEVHEKSEVNKQVASSTVSPMHGDHKSSFTQVRGYDNNPFQMYRANILKLYGFRGEERPMPILKTLSVDNSNLETLRHLIYCLQNMAARIIQDFWKRFIFKAVYKYLRYLLYYYSGVNPSTVLRPINPIEASLLDAASGAYIRFRLGGNAFPPVIFYKIFTKRPVVEIRLNNTNGDSYLRTRNNSSEEKLFGYNNCVGGEKVSMNRCHQNISDCRLKTYRSSTFNDWRIYIDYFKDIKLISHKTQGLLRKNAYQVPCPRNNVDQSRKKKKLIIERMKKMYKIGKEKCEENVNTEISCDKRIGDNINVKNMHPVVIDKLPAWKDKIEFEVCYNEWCKTANTYIADNRISAKSNLDQILNRAMAVLNVTDEHTITVVPRDAIKISREFAIIL